MLDGKGQVYMVHFQNDPQHLRAFVNELLTSRWATARVTISHSELVKALQLPNRECPGKIGP
jgi:hypothetical protein